MLGSWMWPVRRIRRNFCTCCDWSEEPPKRNEPWTRFYVRWRRESSTQNRRASTSTRDETKGTYQERKREREREGTKKKGVAEKQARGKCRCGIWPGFSASFDSIDGPPSGNENFVYRVLANYSIDRRWKLFGAVDVVRTKKGRDCLRILTGGDLAVLVTGSRVEEFRDRSPATWVFVEREVRERAIFVPSSVEINRDEWWDAFLQRLPFTTLTFRFLIFRRRRFYCFRLDFRGIRSFTK